MASDRRTQLRRPRLLRVRFTWDGEEHVGITTDLSLGGAFINTTIYPESGEIIELIHVPEGSDCEIVFRSVVRRVADPRSRHSLLPGLGVSFDQVSTTASIGMLEHLLRKIFHETLTVFKDEDHRAVWVPGSNNTQPCLTVPSGFFADLKALEPVQPDPTRDRAEMGKTGRRAQRREPDPVPEVVYYVRGVPTTGQVQDVSLRGLFVECADELPAVGDVATIHYPLPDPGELEYARIVGAVVRHETEGAARGFGVAILRVHNMGYNATFEAHIAHLEARRARQQPDDQKQLGASPASRAAFRRGTRLGNGTSKRTGPSKSRGRTG
ncbi:MAG: hypothetical protein ACI9WU_002891 [Myxococcota bacterium]